MAINFLNITETLVEARINDNTVGSNLPTPRLAFKENGVVSGGISTTGGNLILETSSGTERVRITTTGNAVFAGDISLADGKKLQLGAANDLQIYHDATNSYIVDSGTGNLNINATNLALNNGAGTKTYILATDGGSVQLRHNDSTKLESTSTGITVTGVAKIQYNGVGLDVENTASNGADTGIRIRGARNGQSFASGNLTSYALFSNYDDNTTPNSYDLAKIGAGMYDASADTGYFRIMTNNGTAMTKALDIDKSQNALFYANVGIGGSPATVTHNPHLDIVGNRGTLTVGTGYFEDNGSTNFLNGARPLAFGTGGTERMRINSSGFVGIGSNSPVAPLEVKSSETNHLTLYRPANTTEGNAGSMNFDGNDSDSNQQTYAKIESFTDDPTAGSHAGKISFSIAKGANGITSAMTIQKDAQVSLNQYGQGSYTGTAAYTLQVDSAGNIIEGSTSGGGTVTGSGTATRVAFWSGTTALSSDANLYWDNTNNRLGIGLTNPSKPLTVQGIIRSNGDTSSADFYSTGNDGLVVNNGNANLRFWNNAAERMRITSAGNVGIGTTAPNETLSLYKLDRPYIQFISNTTGTTSSDGSFIGFANADGFLEIRNKEAQPIRLSTSDTERMRITSVGKVGIGTTSPASPLHIYQNGGDTSTGAGITIEQDGTGDAVVQYLLTGNRRWVAGVDNSDSDRFKFASSADVGTNTVVTINTSEAGGNVGIGTTSPTSKLNVYTSTGRNFEVDQSSSNVTTLKNDYHLRLQASGGYNLQFYTGASATEKMRITSSGELQLTQSNAEFDFTSSSSSGYKTTFNMDDTGLDIGHNSSGRALNLQTNSTDRLTITGAGNVGIGTTSPGSLLHVDGSITSAALQVNQTGTGIIANFKQGGNSKIVIDNDGDLGIGTTSPSAKLEVVQGVGSIAQNIINEDEVGFRLSTVVENTTVNTVVFRQGIYHNTTENATIAFGRGNNTTGGFITFQTNNGTTALTLDSSQKATFANDLYIPDQIIHSGDTNTYIQFHAADQFRVVTGGTERFEVNNTQVTANSEFIATGDVGIGTTSPNTKLHVSSAAGFPQIRFQEQGIAEAVGLRFQAKTGAEAQVYADIKFDPDLAELVINNPYNSGTQSLTVDSSSNVLVGNDLYVPDQIIHTGDTDTYMQFNAADTWRIVTGGNERMRVDSSGNVGIDVSSPQGKFHVVGSALGNSINNTSTDAIFQSANANQALLSIQNYRTSAGSDWTSASKRIQMRIDSTHMGWMQFNGTGNNGGISWGAGTSTTQANITEKMTLKSNGRLGIGTTGPAELLEVAGNAMLDASSARFKIKGGTTGTSSGIDWTFNSNTTQYAKIELDYDLRGSTGLLIDSGYPMTLDYSSSRFAIRYNGTEQMRIETTGDVGINITNPNAKLHVDEPSTSANSLTYGAAAGQIFTNENSEFAFGLLNASPYPLYIQGRTSSNTARNITLQGLGGNIGIGTYSPDGKLTVSGTGISTAPTISVINTSSTTFNHSINAFTPNLTSGESNILVFGRAGSTKNSAYIGYRYSGTSGSNDNLLILGHWASDNLMTISGDGKVGIGTGTTSPTDKLQIDAPHSQLRLRDTDDTTFTQFSSSGGKLAIRQDSTTASHFWMNSSGNVGIGNSNPANKLSVNLTSSVALASQPAVPLFVGNNGNGVDGRVFIDVKHDVISTASAIGAGLRMQAGAVTTGTASYNSSLIFLQSAAPGSNTIHSAPKAIQFYVDNHDTAAGSGSNYSQYGDLAMTIAENASVGIGTTSPGTVNGTAFGGVMLHVKGPSNIGRLVLEGAVQGTMLMNATGSTANQRLKFIQSKQNEFRMGKVSDSGTETTQLAIDDAGDVILQAAGKGLVLVSPNGTTYRLSVTNDGELETTVV